VAEILRGRSSLQQAAKALVDAANQGGGKDNITVVLFKLVDEAAVSEQEDSDTLSGTEQLPAQDAVAPGDGEPGGDTIVMPPAEVERERAIATAEPGARSGVRGPGSSTEAPPTPDTRHPTPPAPPPTPKRRARWPIVTALILIIAIAVVGGLYAASRQLYFVGTDRAGLITLYRGVPYELPLGVKLYTDEYESTVPAASLPARQRSAVLNNRLRSRGDAVDLVRSLERGQD
jgi:PPM family protein phosphatase